MATDNNYTKKFTWVRAAVWFSPHDIYLSLWYLRGLQNVGELRSTTNEYNMLIQINETSSNKEKTLK